MRPAKPPKPFSPKFPIYLMGSHRAPVIICQSTKTFAAGFSNRELAELVASQFGAQQRMSMGVLVYSDPRTFLDTVAQLLRQGVTHMSWDLTANSKSAYFVNLDQLLRAWSDDIEPE